MIFFFYLHGDAAAALQVVAGGQRDGGGDGGRGAGLQAVARADELRQGLQGVDAQLDEVALEGERAEGSAGGLGGAGGGREGLMGQLRDGRRLVGRSCGRKKTQQNPQQRPRSVATKTAGLRSS